VGHGAGGQFRGHLFILCGATFKLGTFGVAERKPFIRRRRFVSAFVNT
jgi:hypothetical protein